MAIVLGTEYGYVEPGTAAPFRGFEDSRTLSIEGPGDWRMDESERFIILRGATGLQFPPVDVQTANTPGGYGGYVRQRQVKERQIFLPVHYRSTASHADFLARMGELFRSLSPLDFGGRSGDVKLVASSASGTREITCTYTGGLEGDTGEGNDHSYFSKFGLNFVATDPYWKARTPESATFNLKGVTPYLTTTGPWPRQLSTSRVIGENMPLLVGGQVPVWPKITIQGPAQNIHISTGTGMDVTLNGPFLAGETLFLETDPTLGRKLLRNGTPSWKTISRGAQFAQMLPGQTTISTNMESTTVETEVRIEWTPGYYAAWG